MLVRRSVSGDEALDERSDLGGSPATSFQFLFGFVHFVVGGDRGDRLALSLELRTRQEHSDVLLQEHDQLELALLEQILDVEQRARQPNEDLALAETVLVRLEVELLDQLPDGLFGVLVARPGGRTQALVACGEVLVVTSVGEAGSSHAQVLHQTEVLDLMSDDLVAEVDDLLVFVRLDAANVPGLFALQQLHQLVQTVLELCDHGQRPFLLVEFAGREDRRNDRVFRVHHRSLQVAIQLVVVLVEERVHRVHHVAGIVLDVEILRLHLLLPLGVRRLVGGEMRMATQYGAQFGEERQIAGVARSQALLIQYRNDALVLLLDQVANDHVVEIVDRLPFDLLAPVLILLGLQRQFDEQLL